MLQKRHKLWHYIISVKTAHLFFQVSVSMATNSDTTLADGSYIQYTEGNVTGDSMLTQPDEELREQVSAQKNVYYKELECWHTLQFITMFRRSDCVFCV